jgi:hypothetical protein
MSAMSSMHRAALSRLGQTPRPVFLDTTAGFETNVGAIAEKAVEYYAHHLQTDLKVASYRHRERASASETAAAVAAVRESNLIFAGPGSPTYAIRQWRDSPLWQAVTDRFMEGADVLFASAASICLGRYALPVYEIYKAGEDPYWADGLDLLSHFGLSLAIVPHYDDASGGENYDSRFCYMGARRFDELQRQLPADVSIVGIDAYTSICFDPATRTASIAGQGGITLIGGHGQERFEAGATVPFETFSGGSRENVTMFNASEAVSGYAFADDAEESDDPMQALQAHINSLDKLTGNEKVDILARLHQVEAQLGSAAPESQGQLVDLVIELRKGMREAKRFDLADRARDALLEAGYEIQDTPEGTRWTRQ